MDKALFLGLSAAVFIGYALVANALLVPDQESIVFAQGECITQGTGVDESCISDDPVVNIPILGPIIQAAASALSLASDLFGPFFQLITFQAKGLEAASIVTAIIFVPLSMINAFIIFSVIRGSG